MSNSPITAQGCLEIIHALAQRIEEDFGHLEDSSIDPALGQVTRVAVATQFADRIQDSLVNMTLQIQRLQSISAEKVNNIKS